MKLKSKLIVSMLMISLFAISIAAVSAEDVSDIEVSQSDIDVVALAEETTYNVNNSYNQSQIQDVINGAKSGDTINFANGTYGSINDSYNLEVSSGLIFVGNGATIYGGNTTAIFNVKANDTSSIEGASFFDFNFIMTGETEWNGRGIQFNNGLNSAVKNCTFTNGNAGIYSRGSSNITVTYCTFNGTTNTSTIGSNKESGMKALSIMGSDGLKVTHNSFVGNVLDGASIASNSRNVVVGYNTFDNCTYGIFFGGGSNATIEGNEFKNNKVNAISLKKCSADTTIVKNTFACEDGTNVIYLAQGDTSHGDPTDIGNVHINDNKFTSDGNPWSVKAVYVFSNGGPLEVKEILEVKNNSLAGGITLFTFVDNNWFNGTDVIITPEEKIATIETENVTKVYGDETRFVANFTDKYGEALANAEVIFNINGVFYNRTTDENGTASIGLNMNAGTYTMTTYNLVTGEKAQNSVVIKITITAEDITLMFKNGTKFQATFLDKEGNVLKNGTVQFNINGVLYTRTTDENGTASMNINLQPNNYTITSINTVTGEQKGNNIVVKSVINATDLEKTYGEQKAFTATILDGQGNPVAAGKTVQFNINGVLYNRITDANGVASLNINLNPDEYIITTEYNGCFVSNKVVVKAA